MKHPVLLRTASAVVIIGVLLGPVTQACAAGETDVATVMQKNAMVFKVIGSDSQATFVLSNKEGQERVRTTHSTTKLQPNGSDNMRVTRFLSPPDVKGTASLMIEKAAGDDALWVYLPALKKVRRLASSNMKDSFFGTDFSNADVIGFKLDEWSYALLRDETLEGAPCYVIEATPKTDAVKARTGYAKRVQWIRKDNLMTVKAELSDEAGQALKTLNYRELQLVDVQQGKWQAMRMEAANLQTGHHTSIRIESFKLNPKVPDAVFATSYLERE